MWHFVIEGETYGPVEETDIAARLRGGQLTAESLVWREGMADWLPISQTELHAYLPAGNDAPTLAQSEVGGHTTPGYREGNYRPAGVLTLLCTVFLGLSILADSIDLVLLFLENNQLQKENPNAFYYELEMTGIDLAFGFIGLAMIGIFLANVVLFCMWIFRANKNARSLGGKAWMKYSPGWSVGWFFIPIANLWKPFQAMREIFNASQDPNTPDSSDSKIVGFWWTCWLVANFVGQFYSRKVFAAETVQEVIDANTWGFAADLTSILSAFAAIVMVRATYHAQQQTAIRQERI